MSSVENTDNNIVSLDSIIGSLSVYYDEEPNETIIVNKKKVREFDNYVCIEDGENSFDISKLDNDIKIFKNKIEIYKKKYHCELSQQDEEPLKVQYGYSLNEHVATINRHRVFDLKLVPYTHIGYLNTRNFKSVGLVFNIKDTRQDYTYAAQQLQKILPPELVFKIISYLGCEKMKQKYELSDFPFNFVPEYKGNIPTYLSRSQLRKLYDLGMIKISIFNFENQSHSILSDEAYDHIYPNNAPNYVRECFETKEKMHKFIENILNKMLF